MSGLPSALRSVYELLPLSYSSSLSNSPSELFVHVKGVWKLWEGEQCTTVDEALKMLTARSLKLLSCWPQHFSHDNYTQLILAKGCTQNNWARVNRRCELGNGESVVEVRGEGRGRKYAYGSMAWNMRVRDIVKYTGIEEPGIFYLSGEEFEEMYPTVYTIDISLHTAFNATPIRITSTAYRRIVRLSVQKQGNYHLSIEQDLKEKPLKTTFTIVRICSGMFKFVATVNGDNSHHTFIDKQLGGEYIALIEVSGTQQAEVVLSSAGPSCVAMKVLEDTRGKAFIYDYIAASAWNYYARKIPGEEISSVDYLLQDGSNQSAPIQFTKLPPTYPYLYTISTTFFRPLLVTLKLKVPNNIEIVGPDGLLSQDQEFMIESGAPKVMMARNRFSSEISKVEDLKMDIELIAVTPTNNSGEDDNHMRDVVQLIENDRPISITTPLEELERDGILYEKVVCNSNYNPSEQYIKYSPNAKSPSRIHTVVYNKKNSPQISRHVITSNCPSPPRLKIIRAQPQKSPTRVIGKVREDNPSSGEKVQHREISPRKVVFINSEQALKVSHFNS